MVACPGNSAGALVTDGGMTMVGCEPSVTTGGKTLIIVGFATGMLRFVASAGGTTNSGAETDVTGDMGGLEVVGLLRHMHTQRR